MLFYSQGSVPTSGEFVPRLGISTSFGEKSGELSNLGFFSEIAFLGINLGKVVVTRFYLMWNSGYDLLSVSGKSRAELNQSYIIFSFLEKR